MRPVAWRRNRTRHARHASLPRRNLDQIGKLRLRQFSRRKLQCDGILDDCIKPYDFIGFDRGTREKVIARAFGFFLGDLQPVRINLQGVRIGIQLVDRFAIGLHIANTDILVVLQKIGISDVEPHRLALESIGVVAGRNDADLLLIELV